MTSSSHPVSAAPPDGAPKLKRSMGLWMATALVVGGPRCMSCPIERDDL